jgi:hypothetical protein
VRRRRQHSARSNGVRGSPIAVPGLQVRRLAEAAGALGVEAAEGVRRAAPQRREAGLGHSFWPGVGATGDGYAIVSTAGASPGAGPGTVRLPPGCMSRQV